MPLQFFSYATRGGAQNVAHTRFSYIPYENKKGYSDSAGEPRFGHHP